MKDKDLNQVFRIAINHQENAHKWHHNDGWPRKVISSIVAAETIIRAITDLRDMDHDEITVRLKLLANWMPNLTVQTMLAIREDRYLYISDWEPTPHGMIITFPPESGAISVPANSHARRLT